MNRAKVKGRQPTDPFYWIPNKVHRSADYRHLSGHAVKLLNALAYQFNGNNNGDLTASWSVMEKQHGFRSPSTLNNAKKELVAANLIYVTRQGGMGMCSLYALTWMPVDECKDKLDCRPTTKPIRSEWHQKQVTTPKKKLMKDSTIVEFAERKERMKR